MEIQDQMDKMMTAGAELIVLKKSADKLSKAFI